MRGHHLFIYIGKVKQFCLEVYWQFSPATLKFVCLLWIFFSPKCHFLIGYVVKTSIFKLTE